MSDARDLGRLDRAIALFVQFRSGAEPGTAAEFAARHQELRDLLEPMLQGDAPDTLLPARRVLGDFELLHEIGRGGIGVVYAAHQVSLDREVAVKVLPPHVTHSATTVARFKREAGIAARLRHPGIVEIYAVGTEGDTHYFAMERVRGEPLDRWAGVVPSDDRARVTAVVELAAAVADALEHAHRSGVIHRDVKPGNVLVREDGVPVLTDFGLAHAEGQPALTRSGEFQGTPHYVAPEQAAGQEVDARSDVFSLGATLYELLTTRRPFEGATTQAVLSAILRAEPRDPRSHDPRLAPDLAAVVLKALEKEPARRYQTAAAFAADLRNFLAYRPVQATRPTRLDRLRRWVRREPFRATLLALLLLGVVGGSAAVAYLSSQRAAIRFGAARQREEQCDIRIARAYALFAGGESAAARREFEAVLALDPDHVDAIAGRALLDLPGSPADVLRQLAAVPALLAHSNALRRLQQRALRNLGREVEAARILVTMPEEPVDCFLLGMSEYSQRGQDADRTRQCAERALPWFAHAVLASPRPRAFFHELLANAANDARNRDLALAVADSFAQLWPDAPFLHSWTARALVSTAPERACEEYALALAREGESVTLCYDWGCALRGLGRLDAAIAQFRRAIVLQPDLVPAQRQIVYLLAQQGEREAALREARRFAASASSALLYLDLANQLNELGRDEEARDAYARGLGCDPDSHPLRHGHAFVLWRLGRRDEALAEIRRAVALAPAGSADSLRAESWMLAQAGDHAGAEAACRRAITAQPRDASAQAALGLALFSQEKWGAAKEPLRQAVSLDPRAADAAAHLAWCELLSGEVESGRARLAAVLAAGTRLPFDLGTAVARARTAPGGAVAVRTISELVLASSPASALAHAHLVDALRELGPLGALRDELQRWVGLHPTDAAAWADLAEGLLTGAPERREVESAMRAIATGLACKPEPALQDRLTELRRRAATK